MKLDSQPALRSLNGFLTRCETKSSTTVGHPKSTVRLAEEACCFANDIVLFHTLFG